MIKIGLIGCGTWGRNYIRNFEHLDDVKMYACCDFVEKNLKHSKRVLPTIKTYCNPEDLIADDEIDAIIIATPAKTHFDLAKKCLNSGKHVLVEKPLTLTSKESKTLIELAKKQDKILMVGHIMEFNPAVVRLKEIIDSRELGNIYYMYLNRTNLGRIREDVNVMWDLAPHDISIVNYLIGQEPKRVSAKGESYIVESTEDVVFLLMEFESNILASIHVSWLDPCKLRRTTVIGDKKMAVFDDTENVDKIRIYDRGVTYNPKTEREFEDFGSFQLAYKYGDIHIPQLQLSEPLKNQCTHFVECIKTGNKPKTDGENGLRVVEVLAAAQKSLENDGVFVDIE
ncbi:Gfo/Idh/MocA family oxidoreductase [Candidatus Oleimmundimicrobium sp.]|uniref:Gfo/Idh/MocA family protein n=1 Tax=Candidatus Oleimmundimicrobium sp. TaxID=3060597 RepID=UPI0027254743|nr:Gfo/Idh/MocA family oxidoreductase [Candidatus Oleimmundimicrobium sp.]MDO8885560.1 Gfo/Idh/MocA family oxidoreductase [Candidatus Oleimmundimicrobium sp.]